MFTSATRISHDPLVIMEQTFSDPEMSILHSFDDQPAVRVINKQTDRVMFESWFTNGLLDRTGKPAKIDYVNGVEMFFNEGQQTQIIYTKESVNV